MCCGQRLWERVQPFFSGLYLLDSGAYLFRLQSHSFNHPGITVLMNETNKARPKRFTGATILLLSAITTVSLAQAQEQVVRDMMQTQTATEKNSVQTQKRINTLAEQTASDLAEYRVKVQELERLRVYNNHLQSLVNDQEQEKARKISELERATTFEQEVVPLMLQMIEDLETFVELDLPFLPEERAQRLETLKDIMASSNVTVSEKYRRIMEAYQVEVDYGRTIEAYTGELPWEGETREVNFLRVGRLVLAFQSRDRDITGFWNKTNGDWEELPDRYRDSVTRGLRIARKQTAPNLLTLPVPSASGESST